ncbi:hypothetical protein E2562_037013 [Oryza meyeriana var. granulata]|uniref:Uncharacterized protein n=1 Tax=Oryza meyeriana var. granulata TaxID=110450 RepID=A0A6G1CXX8_9ORYZ|nr:hypothetical protein E2562_037013 [Oryza meyeriana var. granulata]
MRRWASERPRVWRGCGSRRRRACTLGGHPCGRAGSGGQVHGSGDSDPWAATGEERRAWVRLGWASSLRREGVSRPSRFRRGPNKEEREKLRGKDGVGS